MGVDAEDILVCVWRFLHFSMRTSSKCIQKYPSVSGTLLFLFILYAFFNLFVFFSPFLVCVALLLRVFWTSGGLTILEAKQDDKRRGDRKTCKNSGSVGDEVVVNRDESSSLQKQKSRRTNVKRIDWDGQCEKEEKQASTLATSHVSRTILLGKEAKGLNTQEKERAFDHGESSNAKMSAAEAIQVVDEDHSILDSDRDILSSGSSDDESEKFEGGGSKEEAAKEDGNKAVQWTDDDQQNLMDLGLSEIERNKRLESLIARRRARKLFKMQIEKGLIDLDTILPGQIAPLYIARNNPFIAEMDGMQTPGSAPSVMFPAKNPFDLPYDPLEEKPDLKADSFQQEFTAVTQKDMLYCRHESFCYGAAFALEPKKRAIDELGFSRFRKQSSNANFHLFPSFFHKCMSLLLVIFLIVIFPADMGPHDKRIERMLSNKGEHDELVETLLAEVKENISRIDSISEVVDSEATTPNLQATTSGEAKDERGRERQSVVNIEGMSKTKNDHNVDVMSTTSESHMQPHVTDDSNDESTSSGMSEEDEHEQTFTANRSGFSQNAASKVGRVPPKPLTCSIPSPSNEKGRLEERLFYAERGHCHTPTYSIASDLQVEVSDIGSPPLTVDGANSPTDRESLNLDGDFEREYMWAASSQSSRTEESDLKFRDVRGSSERDLAGMGFSRNSKNTKDVAESSMPFQQADELDDTYSLSSTMTGLQADSRAHSMSLDDKAFDDVRQVVEEVGKPSTSGLSNALSPENQVQAMKSSEKLVAQAEVSNVKMQQSIIVKKQVFFYPFSR